MGVFNCDGMMLQLRNRLPIGQQALLQLLLSVRASYLLQKTVSGCRDASNRAGTCGPLISCPLFTDNGLHVADIINAFTDMLVPKPCKRSETFLGVQLSDLEETSHLYRRGGFDRSGFTNGYLVIY